MGNSPRAPRGRLQWRVHRSSETRLKKLREKRGTFLPVGQPQRHQAGSIQDFRSSHHGAAAGGGKPSSFSVLGLSKILRNREKVHIKNIFPSCIKKGLAMVCSLGMWSKAQVAKG